VTSVIGVGAMSPRKQKEQDWPKSLATARNDVVGDGPHECDFGVQPVADHLVDGCQIFCDRGKKLGCVGGCNFVVSQGGLQSGRSEARRSGVLGCPIIGGDRRRSEGAGCDVSQLIGLDLS